ncbi:LOW QUALITY PROTEIN: COP9 signalosome complex subunit 6 [Passerculus sandwichensis]
MGFPIGSYGVHGDPLGPPLPPPPLPPPADDSPLRHRPRPSPTPSVPTRLFFGGEGRGGRDVTAASRYSGPPSPNSPTPPPNHQMPPRVTQDPSPNFNPPPKITKFPQNPQDPRDTPAKFRPAERAPSGTNGAAPAAPAPPAAPWRSGSAAARGAEEPRFRPVASQYLLVPRSDFAPSIPRLQDGGGGAGRRRLLRGRSGERGGPGSAGNGTASAGNNGGMEVDGAGVPQVMAGGVTGSVSVALHPLVILNISDHWIRLRSQEGRNGQVIGALIGRQEGRNIEVMNSFELLAHGSGGALLIDKEYYYTKEEQFKQVFKDLEFLGWYTTGGPPEPADIHVHKQVCEIIESPLFLKLNPMTKHTDLPVSVFESVIDIINGEATMLFAELPYTLATEEAERIGVDHVARMTATGGENSTVAEHLIAQHSAIKMLHSRVRLILEYVRAAEAGEVPFNHEILREACALCHCLPVLSTDKFKTDFYDQCNDVGLMAYLGTITKTCNTMNQFVNKFNVLYDRQGIGRRMRGLFF